MCPIGVPGSRRLVLALPRGQPCRWAAGAEGAGAGLPSALGLASAPKTPVCEGRDLPPLPAQRPGLGGFTRVLVGAGCCEC